MCLLFVCERPGPADRPPRRMLFTLRFYIKSFPPSPHAQIESMFNDFEGKVVVDLGCGTVRVC